MTTGQKKSATIVLSEIPAVTVAPPNAAKTIHGRLVPPQQQILLYESGEWESFIQEWVHFQRSQYVKVVRFTGANDMGIDVAGLADAAGLQGIWDNYQCKHYAKALTPSVALPEIGKLLWHAFNEEFAPPRKYYFMAPKECGLKLKKLLLDAPVLKAKLIASWDERCAASITSTTKISLDGTFLAYVEAFDFSIFTFKTTLELIDEHRKTPYFAVRFGGGLADRPPADQPPPAPADTESRYLQQLFAAYGDHKKLDVKGLGCLNSWPELGEHYNRQREFFYHAESLRNFARDNVPPGTFEELQDEVYAGVADLATTKHDDALALLNTTTQTAAELPLTANGLISVTRIQDKRGICHQLANADRLIWVKK